MMQEAQGAVIDASLITSAARPRKELVVQEVEVSKEGEEVPQVYEKQSADPDARWVKKGKRSYFGYRAYAVTDEEGYIRGMHTASAHESEVRHMAQGLSSMDSKPKRLYGDKGYASQSNRQYLQGQQIKSALMHKAKRNQALSARQKLANRLISKVRFVVEQSFGTLKRIFGMARARYFSLDKVNGQLMMKSMCVNLLKAANKIQLSPRATG